MRRFPSVLVALAVAAGAAAGVALAAPVGGDGTVQLCFSQLQVDVGGVAAAYVVDPGASCPAETPDRVAVNQAGPQGLPGPQGPTGTSGPQVPARLIDTILRDALEAQRLAGGLRGGG